MFEKGKLDAELIQQIVVTKQDEVRTELTKRLITKRLNNSNLPIKRFASQNLDVLFSDAASGIKKKELLKNATELALVIGFAEYYLRDVQFRLGKILDKTSINMLRYNPNDTITIQDGHIVVSGVEIDFLLEYMRNLDIKSRQDFLNYFFQAARVDSLNYASLKSKIEAHQNRITKRVELKDGDKKWILKYGKGFSQEDDKLFYDTCNLNEKVLISLMYYNVYGLSLNTVPILKDKNNNTKGQTNSLNTFIKESIGKSYLSNPYLSKVSLLSQLKNSNKNESESKQQVKMTSPNHLYTDHILHPC